MAFLHLGSIVGTLRAGTGRQGKGGNDASFQHAGTAAASGANCPAGRGLPQSATLSRAVSCIAAGSAAPRTAARIAPHRSLTSDGIDRAGG